MIAVQQLVMTAAHFFDQFKGDKANDGGEDGDEEKNEEGD